MAKAKEEEGKEVVNWKEKLQQEAKQVAKNERPAVGFISTKGGMLTYMEASVPMLPAVIAASIFERAYYDSDYDPDNIQPPACFAQAEFENALIPHESVPNPVAASCHACPYSKFGSAKGGTGKGQACKIRRKLGLFPATAENFADCEIAVLQVPPTSGKNFSAYANKIASAAGLPPWATITEISCSPDPRVQIKVTFEPGDPLPESVLGSVFGRIEQVMDVLLEPIDMTPQEEPEESNKF